MGIHALADCLDFYFLRVEQLVVDGRIPRIELLCERILDGAVLGHAIIVSVIGLPADYFSSKWLLGVLDQLLALLLDRIFRVVVGRAPHPHVVVVNEVSFILRGRLALRLILGLAELA